MLSDCLTHDTIFSGSQLVTLHLVRCAAACFEDTKSIHCINGHQTSKNESIRQRLAD